VVSRKCRINVCAKIFDFLVGRGQTQPYFLSNMEISPSAVALLNDGAEKVADFGDADRITPSVDRVKNRTRFRLRLQVTKVTMCLSQALSAVARRSTATARIKGLKTYGQVHPSAPTNHTSSKMSFISADTARVRH